MSAAEHPCAVHFVECRGVDKNVISCAKSQIDQSLITCLIESRWGGPLQGADL